MSKTILRVVQENNEIKKIASIVVASLLIVVMTGCSTMNATPYSGTLHVNTDANLKANVTVGAKIYGKASGAVLFGFIPLGMPERYADGVAYSATSSSFSFFSGDTDLVKSAAAYDAVSQSHADVIIAPQYTIVTKSYFLYKTIDVTVVGFKGTLTGIKSVQ